MLCSREEGDAGWKGSRGRKAILDKLEGLTWSGVQIQINFRSWGLKYIIIQDQTYYGKNLDNKYCKLIPDHNWNISGEVCSGMMPALSSGIRMLACLMLFRGWTLSLSNLTFTFNSSFLKFVHQQVFIGGT